MPGGRDGAPQAPDSHYSSVFAFAYIFNLVVGVGALALPLAFSQAGLVLGTFLVVTLAFMSYMTTSYVIEAMAAANAYDIFKEREKRRKLSQQSSDIQKDLSLKDEATETTPLVPSATDTDALFSDESTASGESDDYEIAKKYEMVRGL
jgi:hypothetical protein